MVAGSGEWTLWLATMTFGDDADDFAQGVRFDRRAKT
jgi:hypothetical protein